jgi:hypothetical protein
VGGGNDGRKTTYINEFAMAKYERSKPQNESSWPSLPGLSSLKPTVLKPGM